jgi:hypothetical protein
MEEIRAMSVSGTELPIYVRDDQSKKRLAETWDQLKRWHINALDRRLVGDQLARGGR